jgi:hypothetical protein
MQTLRGLSTRATTCCTTSKFPPNENCSSSQCPPAELFKTHTEWFWPRNDSTVYGQLCWSNQSLIEYVC